MTDTVFIIQWNHAHPIRAHRSLHRANEDIELLRHDDHSHYNIIEVPFFDPDEGLPSAGDVRGILADHPAGDNPDE